MKSKKKNININLRLLIPLVILFCIFTVFRFMPQQNVSTREMLFMGTTARVSIVSGDKAKAAEALEDAFGLMKKYEDMFSFFSPKSELTILNNNAAQKTLKVSPDLFEIINRSLEYSRLTGGVFDVTATSLQKEGGYDTIDVNAEEKSVHFNDPRTKIDLGGIADGFCIDRIRERFKALGVNNYLIDIGGDIYAGGVNEQGRPWRLGVRDPLDEQGILYRFPLTDEAVTTSGNYLRKHIVSLEKEPASGNTVSVTVAAPECIDADVYATAFFIMGPEKTKEFIKNKAKQVQAFFILKNKTEKYRTEKINWEI